MDSRGLDGIEVLQCLALRIGNDRIDLRLIEINYAPVFAEDRPLTGDGIDVPITINGRTANNWTVGFASSCTD